VAHTGVEPCAECRRAYNDGLIDAQDCSTCKKPRLSNENLYAWELISKAAPGLFDGMGGIRYSAIALVLDLYEVSDRAKMFEMIVAYAMAMQQVQREKAKG
jgi:serine/threonine protein phosphatase PrpC